MKVVLNAIAYSIVDIIMTTILWLFFILFFATIWVYCFKSSMY